MALTWYSAVEIRSGHAGRNESIWVRDLDEATAARALLEDS